MTNRVKWFVVLVAMMSTIGCVAQSERDALQANLRRSQEQVVELKARLEEANARIAALEAARHGDATLVERLQQAELQNAEYARKLAALEDQIRRLGMGPLDPMVDAALRDLAATNPDLMTYDPDRGMVLLKSDLTFALGSTTVSDRARATLTRLAEIVRQPMAGRYEVRVVGHTDNVPVRNPANVQKYGDNWGLSAGRAISVMRVLRDAGVAEARMGIGGYGEHRPVVPNGARGAEANRRVEIFLVPMPTTSVAPVSAPAAVEAAPAAAPKPGSGPAPAPAAEPEARFK